VDEQVVGPQPDVVVDASLSLGKEVQDRTDPEWGEDMRCDLETELAPDPPGIGVGLGGVFDPSLISIPSARKLRSAVSNW
jgi:hypothetical protein